MKKRCLTICLALSATMAVTAQDLLPYQNAKLPVEQRVDDLLSRLTLDEKVSLMMNTSPAIKRLGIPQWDWWSEALHGVGRNGLSTTFPSCIGMAGAFDEPLLERIYQAVSDEARAKNTELRRQGKAVGKYQCLSFWTPTINIFRDPRWGRGQESYGEDPFMNARMGLRVVRGLQGVDRLSAAHPYYKLHACAKHFAVHSGPEKTRHTFNIEQLPPRDLWETYLPAFKALVMEGGVQQVMCAYQRFEGDPCCGSNRLLQQILRDQWGFNGLVVSDCGAIGDFYREGRHEVVADAKAAAAKGVVSGTDVECGSVYKNLPKALERGDITEQQIDISVRRLLKGRFELGNFDPDEMVEWTSIPMSVVNCKEHRDLALRMGREQMVLLKNNGVLPLQAQRVKNGQTRIMVMGPNAADSLVMWGIYFGQPGHTVTALEGIENKVGKVPYTKACDITKMREQHSIFNLFRSPDGKPGMLAQYWNNTEMKGNPVAETRITSPIHLDNGGNTAFAAGVELTNFTARYRGKFTATQTDELVMDFCNDDGMRIIVNGDTVHNRWRDDRLAYRTKNIKVVKGKTYDIQLDYMQLEGGATLGFDIHRNRETTVDDALKAARQADVVIFVGGISPNLEREEASINEPGFAGGDRTSIELPQVQRDIIKALHDAGKKVILVNCSGSAVALAQEHESTCDAILQAWYAGEQGGQAIADVLFGDYTPGGKLPVTFYRDDTQLPAFDDYTMTNRTYRYFNGKPLYPFGYGLSYTTFAVSNRRVEVVDGMVTVKATVTNTGGRKGAEVVQVYVRRPADTTGPKKALCGYERVEIEPGQSEQVAIALPRERFELWDNTTNSMRLLRDKYELMIGTSSNDNDLVTQTIEFK
ncbi:MAG: glycoside hydrolase family 3 C-terminal domain-containing protein [Prevotella sp.]|nr:glycoside hydrolase family 3 C-terminal domain-containing protein [Prevotella sp.]